LLSAAEEIDMNDTRSPPAGRAARVRSIELQRPMARFAAQFALAALLILCFASARAAAALLDELPQFWSDDRAQLFDLHALRGEPVVLTMAYAACHRVCPTTMQRLLALQRDLDAQGVAARFVIVGYSPETDDPAAWRQYRQTHRLTRRNWHFLVGTREDVEQLSRQLGFDFWRYDQHVMHDSRIVYFDARGSLATHPAP
jgi:cytochrome oxidase Cu insertion factor (SCO1/SenC/PrrC family)